MCTKCLFIIFCSGLDSLNTHLDSCVGIEDINSSGSRRTTSSSCSSAAAGNSKLTAASEEGEAEAVGLARPEMGSKSRMTTSSSFSSAAAVDSKLKAASEEREATTAVGLGPKISQPSPQGSVFTVSKKILKEKENIPVSLKKISSAIRMII